MLKKKEKTNKKQFPCQEASFYTNFKRISKNHYLWKNYKTFKKSIKDEKKDKENALLLLLSLTLKKLTLIFWTLDYFPTFITVRSLSLPDSDICVVCANVFYWGKRKIKKILKEEKKNHINNDAKHVLSFLLLREKLKDLLNPLRIVELAHERKFCCDRRRR